MNILITGGTGFIGSRLALGRLEKGDFVRVLGQVNTEAEAENRRLIESGGAQLLLGSVTEREKVTEAVKDMDVVFHLAAAQHEANVPDQRFWDVNVTGTKNLLEASIQAGVKRFVHGSTIGVYGSAQKGMLDEESSLKPDNIYGVTKREAEKAVLSFKDKIPLVIIRISETYGPGDRRLLKLFKAIKKKAFFMIGKGENWHHPIYIDDLILGLTLAATSENAVGRVFVLAGKEPLTTRQMVLEIAGALGTSVTPFRAPLGPFVILAAAMETLLRPIGIQPPLHRRRLDFFRKSFSFSLNESSQRLGFVPQYSFRQGVEKTIQWYSEIGAM
ncbi:MAG: NAD(P)-dependent oxidoreductase [Nitrospirae bacterium]|nr:NAD(P)-dependent oxidoreductase [Nitrospirota bacterium]